MLVHKARGMHQVSVLCGAGNQPMSSTAHCSLSDLATDIYKIAINSSVDFLSSIRHPSTSRLCGSLWGAPHPGWEGLGKELAIHGFTQAPRWRSELHCYPCYIPGINMTKSSGRAPARQQNMHVSTLSLSLSATIRPNLFVVCFCAAASLNAAHVTSQALQERNSSTKPSRCSWLVVEPWLNRCRERVGLPIQATEMSRTSPALPSSRLARRDLKDCLNQDEIYFEFMNNHVNTWSTSKSTANRMTRFPVEDTPLSSHRDSMLLIWWKMSKDIQGS